MTNSAIQYIQEIPQDVDKLIFPTDFEKISFEKSEMNTKCYFLENEEIIYIRFIYLPDFRGKFPEYKYQEAQLNKYFFLPTHKAREFKTTIKEDIDLQEREFSEQLKGYYTSEMIEHFQPNSFYFQPKQNYTDIDRRTGCSTSLFVLFSEDRFDSDGCATYESILKKKDIDDLSEEELKTFLLNSGLKVSELRSMYNFLISFGYIKTKYGILEWDKTLWTEEPKPGSSHIHFYKMDKAISEIDFQDVANQFSLVHKETVVRPPKRRKSRRR